MPQLCFPRTARHSAVPLSLLMALGACAPPSVEAVTAAIEPEGPEPVVVTVFTDELELFMEYPRLVRGEQARFLAHLTVLATGEPVRSGRLRIELAGPGGDSLVLEAAEPARDGLFVPVAAFEAAGEYAARVVLESEQARGVIAIDPLVVYADWGAAAAAAEAEHAAEPHIADSVPFLLEQQWKIGLLLEEVQRRTLVERLRVPGEIEAPAGALAVVSAPIAGRLLPPDGGALPSIGERVEAGQELGRLEPYLTPSDRAQLISIEAGYRALDAELLGREFDLEAEQLELEKAQYKTSARLDYAKQTLSRIEELREKDLGTVAELESARLEVLVAEREAAGVRGLQSSFERARARFDEFRVRAGEARATAVDPAALALPLVAPVSGEIVAADRFAGENVDSSETVFRVLDPSRVWIRADVSEFELEVLDGLAEGELGALLEFAAYPGRSFDVLGAMGGRVIHIGRMVDPEARTIHLHWEADNLDELLYVGMFADVHLETGRSLDAVAVPQAAIVQEHGQPSVFVLVDGENFQRRVLDLGRRDGRFVEVLAGLEAGERVVTKGANFVRLAAISPASFGEGHAH